MRDMAEATPSVTEATWRAVEPIRPHHARPPRVATTGFFPRRVLEALAFRLATGCPWNDLPRGLADDSTVHRTVQRWRALGIYEAIVAALQGEGDR
jgi:putative transposase